MINNKSLCVAVSEAIKDEVLAVKEYNLLSTALELTHSQRRDLQHIRDEEKEHYEKLKIIYKQLMCNSR